MCTSITHSRYVCIAHCTASVTESTVCKYGAVHGSSSNCNISTAFCLQLVSTFVNFCQLLYDLFRFERHYNRAPPSSDTDHLWPAQFSSHTAWGPGGDGLGRGGGDDRVSNISHFNGSLINGPLIACGSMGLRSRVRTTLMPCFGRRRRHDYARSHSKWHPPPSSFHYKSFIHLVLHTLEMTLVCRI